MTTTIQKAHVWKSNSRLQPPKPQALSRESDGPIRPHTSIKLLYTVDRSHASWTRDGYSHEVMSAGVLQAGIPPGMPIVLMPEDSTVLRNARKRMHSHTDPIEVTGRREDWPSIKPGCLVVMAGRPPSHEDAEGRKPPYFSRTWLEARLLDGVHQVFSKWTRQCISLQFEFARQLAPEYAHVAELYYRYYDKKSPDERGDHFDFMAVPSTTYRLGELSREKLPYLERTYGYIIHIGAVPVLGCQLLAVFGLSGDDTQRLAYSLSPEGPLKHLIKDILTAPASSSRLVVVEMQRTGPRAVVTTANPINKNFSAKIVLDARAP